MKSTKITISNEKTTVSLPTVDDLIAHYGDIGDGQVLIWFPAINQLGIGNTYSPTPTNPGESILILDVQGDDTLAVMSVIAN